MLILIESFAPQETEWKITIPVRSQIHTMLCILINNKDLLDIWYKTAVTPLCGTLLRTSYDIQQATRQHSEMGTGVSVCVLAVEEDRITGVYIILLWKIPGSTVVMMLFNVCFYLFILIYCIAHVYNRVSCAFKMWCVIFGVCVWTYYSTAWITGLFNKYPLYYLYFQLLFSEF